MPLTLCLTLASLSAPPTAWPAGPLEVRVAFDRPVEEAFARGFVNQSIAYGEPTTPDVKAQRLRMGKPLGTLRIAAARLEDGSRTLVLATDPHPREAVYALTLPDRREPILYDLSGVEASWAEGDEEAPRWVGWRPKLDTESLDRGTAEHDRQRRSLGRPGRLTLRTLATFPVSNSITLSARSNAPLDLTVAGETVASTADANGSHSASLTTESTGEVIDISIGVTTGVAGRPTSLKFDLPPTRLILPWAPPALPPSPEPAEPPFDLRGGDPRRGAVVFASEEAKCSACHKVGGKGGEVGPDLSKLADRDRATLYRDIADPSAAIHPDYQPYTVALKNGQVAVGVVRAEGGGAIRVLDVNAKATILPRAEVEELRPSGTSVMPVGLAGALGETKVRDLIAFLLAPPNGE